MSERGIKQRDNGVFQRRRGLEQMQKGLYISLTTSDLLSVSIDVLKTRLLVKHGKDLI